jgi:hypothetical protein
VCVGAVTVLSTTAARSEFILDDFDNPVSVASPEFDEFVITPGVGRLNATRQIRIALAGQGTADAELDSANFSRSMLTGQVPWLYPRDPISDPIVSIQFNYEIASADFTQGGVNNAIFLDFLRLESEIPPSLFTVLLNAHAYVTTMVPRDPGAFTMVIAFDAFSLRGGGRAAQLHCGTRSEVFNSRNASHGRRP